MAICEGTSELRLAALFGGGFVPVDALVSNANGRPFLYIDGTCRYWISGLPGQALTGTLGAEDEERLTSQLRVASWSSFYGGEWIGDGIDGPDLALWRPDGRVDCYASCQGPGVPEALAGIGGSLHQAITILQAEAVPLDGPMRVLAFVQGFPDPLDEPPVIEWTYQPPLSELADPGDGDGAIEPALIADPDAVAAMRAAWLAAQEAGFSFVAARDEDGVIYQLVAHDVLPFERDDGRGVDLPPP
ncbi:MAG TPA: hypothetical protein VKB80_26295 [Kofleriaceae bacterium]|nr:hypothetical protein [Kofleriaceae bacterium]